MKVAALLPAAGSGERLGLGPKAFLPLGSLTILGQAVRSLAGMVTEIVVAVPASLLAEAEALLPDCQVIAGGHNRQETVARLAAHTDAPLVLIHDAARPFLPRSVTQAVLAATRRDGAASPVLPVADTLVSTAGESVPRETLRAVQTPQGFQRDLLLAAQQAAVTSGRQATDEATLVRQLGRQVTLVPGSAWLFKITTPEDLELARAVEPVWTARQKDPTR